MARRASHAKLALRKVPPEICAERMTKLLSSKPSSEKTRAYLATLPKRKKPVIVEPHEFVTEKAREQREAAQTARRVLVKIEEEAKASKSTFKARLRPGARKNVQEVKRAAVSRWACRPTGARYSDVAIPKREPRTLDQVAAQREALSAVQGDICGLCGTEMASEVRRSLDHVIPRSLGGADRLGNLLLSHGECNGVKSNDIPTGCELVMLLAINAKLGAQPLYWKAPPQGTSASGQDPQGLGAKPAGPVRRMRQLFSLFVQSITKGCLRHE